MIDTHAHLLSFENNDEIIDNMQKDGLSCIFSIGTNVEDSAQTVELAEKYDNIYAVIGIYPEYAKDATDADLKKIKDLCKSKKVKAIGEIGLDFHMGDDDKDKQIEIFEKQLKLADEVSLPFCIHCRSAVEDLYKILERNKNLINHSGLMHCYSEGSGWYKKFLDLGMYLSFSGNITYKKSDREFLKKIPLDRILVETDSPYLAPEPVRGTVNQPKNVKFVIERLASEIGITFEELEKITEQNARRFYLGEN